MAMENLSIAQHRNTLQYARICSGAYRPQLRRFSTGDYVYLQREAPTTLDVRTGRNILRVKDVLPSGILLQEGIIPGSVGSTQRIVLLAIYPLMALFIPSWPLCQTAFRVLYVVRRRVRLPCCFVIIASVDGIWLA